VAKRIKSLLFITAILVSLALASDKVFTEYNAQPDANRVLISWITSDESLVKHFIIKRSQNDSDYIELQVINKKGPGTRYEYYDNEVLFKNNGVVFYKILAVKNDGTVLISSESMMVHPNISGIFRTWGAIKAMFR